MFTFVPLFLVNVFKDLINLYFLVVMVATGLVDRHSKSFVASGLALLFLLTFELIKEVIEDVLRAVSDRKINEQECV